jgi:hypothetical protein
MKIHRSIAPLLIALMVAATAAACATRPVNLHGISVTDPFAVNVANRLNNLETTLATTGELLLSARSSFSNEQWDRIADASAMASKALGVSRASLIVYIEKVNAGQDAGTERDEAQKALDVLEYLATVYVAFKGGDA